jgi:hypothetical protein
MGAYLYREPLAKLMENLIHIATRKEMDTGKDLVVVETVLRNGGALFGKSTLLS